MLMKIMSKENVVVLRIAMGGNHMLQIVHWLMLILKDMNIYACLVITV